MSAAYGGGPSLHFYHRIRTLRAQYPRVETFLSCDTCTEILYATLASWDMNSRAARMKDYVDFRDNLQNNLGGFLSVESVAESFTWQNRGGVLKALSELYDVLELMKGKSKLVSNSKCLHFVFPALCMPMDRRNTLRKLYGNDADSKGKFLELLEFLYDILQGIPNPERYLDGCWNTCETKLVDNAIRLM
jgi:hypothetical protein